MAVIGIDCSGKVDDLPMYMVAARGDDCRIIYVDSIPLWMKRSHREWKKIVYACYAFTALKPLFRKQPIIDSVLLDRDFDVEGLQKTKGYLECLIRNYFLLPAGNLVEAGDDSDIPVQKAHVISRLAYRKKVRYSLKNPKISYEFDLALTEE